MAVVDRAAHLSLVLDLSPPSWAAAAAAVDNDDGDEALPLSAFLAQLLAFVHAHLAGKAENTLAVFGALPGRAAVLYSSADAADTHGVALPAPDADSYQPFKVVDAALMGRVFAELDALDDDDVEQPPALVGALSKALCYINRARAASASDPVHAPEPRILVLSVSPDASTAYVPLMNAIFAAQKLKVPIDVGQLFGPPTSFLQQAAHLTGGAHVHLPARSALLQYLLMSFLPPPSLRTVLGVPTQRAVDLRASCFCHRRVVDVACVCSVCLSIFCQPVAVCTTCKSRFLMNTLKRLKAALPAPAGSAASSMPGTPTRNGSTNGSSLPSSNNIGRQANGR